MTDVLIVESDPGMAEDLRQMIETSAGDYRIIYIAISVNDAKSWLTTHRSPQLIVCDIQLSDGLGFDIFQDVNVAAPVIFCTSYDEYALKAFENNGIDYLIKPVSQEKLERSLKKFNQLKELFGEENGSFPRKIGNGASYLTGYKTSLLVYYQDKIIPVNLDQVDFIHYNNYQVNVYTQNAHYETRDTLNNIIATLNPRDFFRANRQFIIHRKSVTTIQQYFGRKLLVGTTYPAPEPVIISKANASDFLKWLEGLGVEENSYSFQ
ncbi:LytR/AlgR family response regulator transcription factor [Dyadobacter sandarakinus]|uniref:Response regulator transcription factor n=1 Tax=Dyadobacter sandarakinus TaxID=2747268 RepID=A0ABX7I2J2_9BACT|nr:LytTR family DNA-binding domain-containing protein [Dyadobacter sandarakinus]QRQ99447.1 response regulator transcription factor [Dyadobacter sandarakinus]